MNKTQKSLYEAIEILIDEKLKNLKYNYTKDGVVKSVSGNKAVVTIDEVDSTCGIRSGLALYPNDLVKVMINKNDYSDKYVDVKLMQINENPTPNSDDIADAVEKKHDSAIVDGHRYDITSIEPSNPAYLDVWIDIGIGSDIMPKVKINMGTPSSPNWVETNDVLKGTTLPTASSAYRGLSFTVTGATGVSDITYICIKNGTDAYEWKTVSLT